MSAERITAAAVTAELDVLDGEAKRVAGDVVVSIGFTNAAVKDLAPREWEELAAYLVALLAREPVRSSGAYAGHRVVLGALATELRGFAAAAGEPVGLLVDLRGAASLAEEHRIRERLDGLHAAFDRSIDDTILTHAIQRESGRHDPEEDAPEDPSPAATPTETDDVLAAL